MAPPTKLGKGKTSKCGDRTLIFVRIIYKLWFLSHKDKTSINRLDLSYSESYFGSFHLFLPKLANINQVMGSNTSKTIMPASTKSPLPETEEEIFNEKSYSLTSTFDNFREQFEGLELENAENEINPISENILSKWEDDFKSQTKNLLAQNALAKNAIVDVIAKNSVGKQSLKDRYLFNITVDTIGSPAHLNNQKLSGRCWILPHPTYYEPTSSRITI